MSVMTAPPLPFAPVVGVDMGPNAVLVEDSDGGRVFVFGVLTYAWDPGDEVGRRLAAVQLVDGELARVGDVAFAFDVSTVTLWRWRQDKATGGVVALVPEQKGPKRRHKLTDGLVAEVRRRRDAGQTLQGIATAVGIAPSSVRRALDMTEPVPQPDMVDEAAAGDEAVAGDELSLIHI